MKKKLFIMLSFLCFMILVLTIPVSAQIWPVPGHRNLTQRFHSNHNGIDISDGKIKGAPVVAAASGKVYALFKCSHNTYPDPYSCCKGFGTGLVIKGDDGLYYSYAHMQSGSIPSYVYRGSYVPAGKLIGRVGNTGNSSGTHLHFTITVSSKYYTQSCARNPLNYSYTYNSKVEVPQDFGKQFDAIIKNDPFNRVACVANGASSTWGKVVTEQYQENSRFKWRFTRNTDGSYTIKSLYNSCVLTVTNASFTNNASLEVIRDSGSLSQKWFIYKNDDGSYRISSAGNTDLILTINNITYDLVLYKSQKALNQSFAPKDIPKHIHSWTSYKITKATPSTNGKVYYKCNCGNTSSTITYKPSLPSLSYTSKTYTGKALYPSVKVKNSIGGYLKSGTDYTVSYSNNKNIGRATAKITFKGNLYSGTTSLSFNIVPKGTTISKLTSAKKGFKVYWKKQTSQTSGYQIRYSTSSKMKSPQIIDGGISIFSSKSVSKLAGGKKYYVQVRTYKKVSGKYYYSSWSPTKAVTTKK